MKYNPNDYTQQEKMNIAWWLLDFMDTDYYRRVEYIMHTDGSLFVATVESQEKPIQIDMVFYRDFDDFILNHEVTFNSWLNTVVEICDDIEKFVWDDHAKLKKIIKQFVNESFDGSRTRPVNLSVPQSRYGDASASNRQAQTEWFSPASHIHKLESILHPAKTS